MFTDMGRRQRNSTPAKKTSSPGSTPPQGPKPDPVDDGAVGFMKCLGGEDEWELCGGKAAPGSATLGDFVAAATGVVEKPVWVVDRKPDNALVKHGWVLA